MAGPVRNISGMVPKIPDSPRVLLVDEDDEHTAALKEGLEARLFVVETLSDAKVAVQRLSVDRPELLLLNPALGQGRGLQICRALKAEAPSLFLPIVAVAPTPDESARLEAYHAGFDHWIARPAAVEELVARGYALVRMGAMCRAMAAKGETLMMWQDWVRYLVHDLRSPISVAMGNIAFVRGQLPEAELGLALDEAHFELDRVASMLQDLLDTDRLRRGVLIPARSRVDLAEVARQTVVSVRILAEEKRAHVSAHASGSATAVDADRALVGRVLSNLLCNAIRFSRATVVIAIEGAPDAVLVRVVNDGPGIAKEIHQRLFEPWSRFEGSGFGSQGTGLGLAFSRMVVEAHGGRIWLDSAMDGNVAFAFSLPRSVGEAHQSRLTDSPDSR